ncbi:sucrose-phosphate synthase [Marchantia polymorpha subsp. ruderalis]|uniref:Sucrose-phosphate synthase n=2 Tax=Marchantia polymorpha TaxID=3197 RepID=A0A176W2C3_MARPO|nr:hypothetical protein AXG93_4332s1220 [Marchantia polymorpha subsp. ruderalis]PTQ31610.1 hypothetical protein MARPO_0109s0040 [Marchantia polymorpha]BBN02652.1 hypothetical protein Mp_2g16990 [Marchantia polymorpha subsp. ruderalis]|eukprot:PTQ31610.1 hypothetical protein MARPO_0109s0040 [Marchantia polymorpha]
MADNEWINGYLEAIINTGERLDGYRSDGYRSDGRTAVQPVLSAANYFVKEVTGYDDAALYRTWIKANASKYPQEKGNRMEYLCWRVWHVARQKKKLAWEDAQRMTRTHFAKQRLLKEVNEEFSEDLSEGEKPDLPPEPPVSYGSNGSLSSLSHLENGLGGRLYIVLISLHGLVRGDNLELGRDSDTGGQVKYVVEFARALAMMPEVYRVDLLTRQICDPEVDSSYGEPTEMLSSGAYDDDDEVGESSGAYIVRIPCGPRDQYIRKELLWPHIQEFVDGALAHIVHMTKVLGEQLNSDAQKIWPYVVHGHYADAGDAASLLSGSLNVPFVMTGHSLGRNKLEQLLQQNRLSREGINNLYKIQRRLEAEEYSLDAAEMVITSTKQEIVEQWGLYDGFDVTTERKLRMRISRGLDTYGRFMPRMHVITPGMDFSSVKVPDFGSDGDGESNAFVMSEMSPASPRGAPQIIQEIMRFFSNPHKPMILALARPDPKKNLTTLLTAFGESKKLRELANLTLVMGNRDDIENMSSSSATILTQILRLVDKYDLYGHVAYPKHHKQTDVPDIYRFAATTKGVFINPALVEPFGLTLIEAAAHGLPIVATKNGGPVDIIKALKNGVLIDPHDKGDIANALLKLMMDRKFWNECRQNGVKNIHKFSWPAHCRAYLSHIAMCRMRHPEWQDDNFVDETTALEYQRDSLTDLDVNDLSLRLSMDGTRDIFSWMEKKENYPTVKKSENGGTYTNGHRNRLNQGYLETVLERGLGEDKPAETFQSKVNMFRRRKHLVVLAIDSYDKSTGKPTKKLLNIINYFLKTFRSEIAYAWRAIGFVLSTSLTGPETVEFLKSGDISAHDFDCLICASGSELFFPILPPNSSHDPSAVYLCPDPYYKEHIEYRWGGDGLKKFMTTIPKLVAEDEESESIGALVEDVQRSNSHNFAYRTINKEMAPCVDYIRSTLRDKGYRNHVMYCQQESKLHILPLLASRSQALRYLFVRYEYDVARMFVVVGETGDTDYEELLAGTHKTIVMKGIVEGGSERLLRGPGNYTREDIVPTDSPNIVQTESDDPHTIMKAFEKVGLGVYIKK